jgi:hypothetical protein
MIKSWLAGDTAIKKAKPRKFRLCIDCPSLIVAKGGKKRCSSCSSLQQKIAQRKKVQ